MDRWVSKLVMSKYIYLFEKFTDATVIYFNKKLKIHKIHHCKAKIIE